MEHWLVVIGAGQGDAALDWAARRAQGRAALEVIASGLEIPDPRGAVLRAADHLQAASSRVPRALHMVPRSLADELSRCDNVDLVVLGSRCGPLSTAETDHVLGLLAACPAPVVLVPGEGQANEVEPRLILWPATGRRPPAGLRAAVRSGREIVRVERGEPMIEMPLSTVSKIEIDIC